MTIDQAKHLLEAGFGGRKPIYFTASELLILGATHHTTGNAGSGKNQLPEHAEIIELARVARLADKLRSMHGSALKVISGYRHPRYNKAIGGAPNSLHTTGRALDLIPADGNSKRLHDTASRLHCTGDLPGGLGFYPWGVHIDTGRKRTWGRKL